MIILDIQTLIIGEWGPISSITPLLLFTSVAIPDGQQGTVHVLLLALINYMYAIFTTQYSIEWKK